MTHSFTQKYAIIQPLEHVVNGYEFTSDTWPLHVTLLDTFATGWSVSQMAGCLSDTVSTISSIEVEVKSKAFFGEHGDIPVMLLDDTDDLRALHEAILEAFSRDEEFALNDPHFAGSGFVPHSTVQKHTSLAAGDVVQLTDLAIVDMFPGGNPYSRKIVATIQLAV